MPAPVTIQKPPFQASKTATKAPPVSPSAKPKFVINGVPVWSLFDDVLPLSELRKRVHPNNDNEHDDTQSLVLGNVIRQNGIRKSITLSRLTGRIVAGHGALKAAPMAGLESFPIAWQDFKSEAEELAHLTADNAIARMSTRNDLQTAMNIDLLQTQGFDLSTTGILEEERTDLLNLLEVHQGVDDGDGVKKKRKKGGKADVDSIDDVSDELEGAAALKPDMLFMPSSAPYNIPELRLDMCMACPQPFDSWAGPDGSPPQEGMHYLYNITSVMRELPIDRAIFGFYADDHRFEVVWNQTARYAAKLINAGFMGAVTPNFSLFFGAPLATHIWNIYRSRWVGRYFQEAGIKIIPDVPAAGLDSLAYVTAGIPKGLPTISLQCQTSVKSKEEIRIRRAVYAGIEKQLEPESIIIYGGDHTEEYLDGCFKNAKPIHILNRMQKRRAVISKNASAAALIGGKKA